MRQTCCLLWITIPALLALVHFTTHTVHNLVTLQAHTRSPALGNLHLKTNDSFKATGRSLLVKYTGSKELLSNLTIFTVPRPFEGETGTRQREAVSSWLALKPQPKIVLLGTNAGLAAVAEEFGETVSWDWQIDANFAGVPLFHSLLARCRVAPTSITALVNPEAILTADFTAAITRVMTATAGTWLLMASAWDLPFPPQTPALNASRQASGGGKRSLLRAIRDGSTFEGFDDISADAAPDAERLSLVVRKEGRRPHCGAVDVWAWDTGHVPLHHGVMPPFVYGRGGHDHWLAHEVAASGARALIDVTGLGVAAKTQQGGLRQEDAAVSDPKGTLWEHHLNAHLAFSYGSFSRGGVENEIIAPWRLEPCSHSPTTSPLCFSERTPIDEAIPSRPAPLCAGGEGLVDKHPRGSEGKQGGKVPPLGLGLSLAELLPIVASENKTVILVVVAFNYAEGLMSFACRLRKLNMTNLIVGAVDEKLYHFASEQGLPVFADLFDLSFHPDKCHFPSKCFQKVTKLKSRTVVRILKLGYNVLMSDIDVIYFENPLPYLTAFGPGTIVGQSDQYNDTGPSNDEKRFNSGFYFARSDNSTIEVLQTIAEHAAASELSEQPSFWIILCGPKGERRVGWDECLCENGLRAIFLDRMRFPNGATAFLWDRHNTAAWLELNKAVVLHNNWVKGRKTKFRRQKEKGYWDYLGHLRMCTWDWANSSQLTVF